MQNVPKIVRDRLQAAPPVGESSRRGRAHGLRRAIAARARTRRRARTSRPLRRLPRRGRALALPEMSRHCRCHRRSPHSWLTWPVLRWGFVAAGIVAIAWFGLVQYSRADSVRSRLGARESAPEARVPRSEEGAPAMRTDQTRAGPCKQRVGRPKTKDSFSRRRCKSAVVEPNDPGSPQAPEPSPMKQYRTPVSLLLEA